MDGIFILSVRYCKLFDEPSLVLDGSELVPFEARLLRDDSV